MANLIVNKLVVSGSAENLSEFKSDKWEWNCKEIDMKVVDEGDDEILYRFSTRVCPPVDEFKAIGKRFDKVDFILNYFESYGSFGGCLYIKKGKIVLDHVIEDIKLPKGQQLCTFTNLMTEFHLDLLKLIVFN